MRSFRKLTALDQTVTTMAILGAVALAVSACDSGGASDAASSLPPASSGSTPNPGNPGGTGAGTTATPPGSVTPPPIQNQRSYQTAVMIYNGSGAWTDEVSSLESIMQSHGTSYTEVTDTQLNQMTATDFASYGMLLFPGGSGSMMLAAINDNTRTLIMNAVRQTGVGYLGFCAGAFLGVSPAPASGQAPAYFSVIQAPEEGYYYLENQGTDEAMTQDTLADGTSRNILWYGGPVTPNIAGGVVAKYPTGDPAITESAAGKGFAIVSGVHPAAPMADIQAFGGTQTDFDIAWNLINSVLTATPLPAFAQ